MRTLLTIMSLFLICSAAFSDPVFDVKALTSTPLNARIISSTERNGIVTEEVMFHSEMDGEKSVDIFAFFSYPKGAAKLPSYIWNQGGLGQAQASNTEYGATRGYATLCIDFPMPGYRSTGGYPIVAGLELGEDPKKSAIYHGVVALLKAVSYLQSRPEVDANRIGMAGSSWGGFYTTLMVGVDSRLKVGSAYYGTGSLQLGNVWWDGSGWDSGRDAAFRERWRTTLDPAWRLKKSKTPIAWFTGTNDVFYWMPALMKTYQIAGGPKNLALLPNYDHALNSPLSGQMYQWLDMWLKDGQAFDKVTPLKLTKKDDRTIVKWKFSGPRKVVSADLAVSYGDAGNWRSRCWMSIPAKISDGTCSVELPSSSRSRCIIGSVVDKDGFRYSTTLKWVDPVGRDDVIPDYDGCAEWGDFEAAHIIYLQGHAKPVPQISQDARTGKQSAILNAGKTTLPSMLFTADISHKLVCYMKANEPTNVNVQMSADRDKNQSNEQNKQHEFSIGSEWTKVELDYLPSKTLVGSIALVITVPEGRKVLVDSISFHPINN